MPTTPNLRSWKVTQSMGKNVSSTKQTSGVAKPTGKMSESNSVVESYVAAPPISDLGGENKHK